ncbi:MAG: formylmethanofuran dehydrogenase subunit C [Planctomycetota bacterium]|nr:MAG: formylmethanofuran dehydrogenase subunit C [Planctomycetota bacterium]
MPLRITMLSPLDVPVEFTGVTCDAAAGRSLDDLRRTPVRQGNQQAELGELFHVEGSPGDLHWQLVGDFSRVHGIGAAMAAGSILVDGSAGRHAGAGMRGGRLEIRGDAGDWLGAEMRGGSIRLAGDAGDHVGGAYPGSRRGMNGGTILLDGDAGRLLGHRMRRGMIAVARNAGERLGTRMRAGTILVFGQCGAHPGAGMLRGTIGVFGPQRPQLSLAFRHGYTGPLPVLHLVEKQLHEANFFPPGLRLLAGRVELHHGDMLELGRGEILLPI